jgi:hypothetical protein
MDGISVPTGMALGETFSPQYSRSHVQQGGGEPESLSRLGLSAMISVLSFLAKAIISYSQIHEIYGVKDEKLHAKSTFSSKCLPLHIQNISGKM